jgi:hypothetical protein
VVLQLGGWACGQQLLAVKNKPVKKVNKNPRTWTDSLDKRPKQKMDMRFGTWNVRPRRRWVDNIKMDLRQIGWDRVDWIDLAQDKDQWRALVNTVLNLRVP